MLSCFHAFLCPRPLFPSSTNVPGIFSESHLPSGWQDTLKGHLSAKLNVVTNKVDIAPLKWYVKERGRDGQREAERGRIGASGV